MANPLLGTLAKLSGKVDALAEDQRKEFNHVGTALGDMFRELADIKARLPVRKAAKVRRRAVHPKSTF